MFLVVSPAELKHQQKHQNNYNKKFWDSFLVFCQYQKKRWWSATHGFNKFNSVVFQKTVNYCECFELSLITRTSFINVSSTSLVQ